jgi:putative ABC transport system permease protein
MGFSRFFRRGHWDQERAREMAAYMEQEIADNILRGMDPEEARYAAHRKLGNTTAIREEIYRMNTFGGIETVWRDVHYAARVLRKAPGFTLVALLSLSLGIGATTAIFSVVYGALISPYPYAKPDRIWAPEIYDLKAQQRSGFSFHRMRDYVELKKLPAFADVMATLPENRLLTGDYAPETFTAVSVTANAFQFLGVAPALGRTILPSDVRPDGDAEPVIVLTYKAWQRLFEGSPAALGRTLVLDDQRFTVIGVMPPRFGWWTSDGGWLALPEDARDQRYVAAIVRLRNGVSAEAAAQQLQSLHLELARQHPEDFPKNGFSTVLHNYMDITATSGEMRTSLQLLFGAVGFLLLIACANVANLQLARGTARAQEIAVRLSIGAGCSRIIRQLLTESVILAIAGGVAGVVLALVLTKTIVVLMPDSTLPNEVRIGVNSYVLLFSAGLSILTGIVFGLAPAFECSRLNLVDTLKDAGRNVGGRAGGTRARKALVMVEVALSVVLLMGAGLTIRGFARLQTLDTGFRADHVLMVGLPLPPKRYATYEQRISFAQRVLESAKELPGVQSAAIGNGGLSFGGPRSLYSIEGRPEQNLPPLMLALISADYPQTMGIPLRAGRLLTPDEVTRGDAVVLINEAARRLWPPEVSPIGKRIRLDLLSKPSARGVMVKAAVPWVTVVGILGDTRNNGLRNPTAPAVYLPYTLVAPVGRILAIRTAGEPQLLLNFVRRRLRDIDKDQPLSRAITLDQVMELEESQPRFNLALFTFFGAMGLILAMFGIYSVLSYIVARRTHEIGIRMALGAGGDDVLRLILTTGGKLTITGLAAGLGIAVALGRILRAEIFQVPDTDAATLLGVTILLSLAALLACIVPALRASKLDPMAALRQE